MQRYRRPGPIRWATAVLLAVMVVPAGCGPSITVPALAPAEAVKLQRESEGVQQRGYFIQAGDTVHVRFPYHPELDQEAVVRPDGKTTLATIGPLTAADLTPPELEAAIKEKASQRLRDPEVMVNITRFGQRSVYVGGEVGRPGMLEYRKGLKPVQAIMAAGGFLPTARVDSVVLIRPGDGDTGYLARKLDLNRVVSEGEQHAVELAPNDVLFVPRSSIANANLWVRQHITDLFPFFQLRATPGLGF